MNKKNTNIDELIKKTAIAIGLTGASFMAACNFSPEENEIEDVYGPPDYFEEESESMSVESDVITDDENESEIIESDGEGSPDMAGDVHVKQPEKGEDMIPELNVPDCVYGPPEMMIDDADKE